MGPASNSEDEAIDTTTASGELVFHILTAPAEFEDSLISERTRAGLLSTRARGRLGGRKPFSATNQRVVTARAPLADKKMLVMDICRTLNLSRPALYRRLAVKRALASPA